MKLVSPSSSKKPRCSAHVPNTSGMPQRGNMRTKVCVRAECSWVHTPSMNGELADRASRCGRYVRSASQTATARSQPRTPTCTCAAQVLLRQATYLSLSCLLYTSDAADDLL